MSPTEYHDGDADPNDPTDERSVPFDWEGLEHAMGEAELGPIEYERLALAMGRVLRWLVFTNPGERDRQRIIARRVLALAWTTDPGIFDDCPSLKQAAKRAGILRTSPIAPYK